MTAAADAGRDTERLGPSFTGGGIVKWDSHSGKHVDNLFKSEASMDPTIPHLGIRPRKMNTRVCAKAYHDAHCGVIPSGPKWKQPLCPSAGERITKHGLPVSWNTTRQ